MKRFFEWGGIAASVILIAFGAGSIGISVNGLMDVRDRLADQKIIATDDAEEITNGALKPGQKIDTGAEAKAFADIMEFHALESTEGQRYAEMGRFLTPEGTDTSDESLAAKDPKTGQPVPNRLRDLWVTQTALATALNTSYFAEQVAYFGIAMGIALLLTGIGFLVLTLGGILQIAPRMAKEKVSPRVATTH